VDLMVAAGDTRDFREAWATVSPGLSLDRRPSARRLWHLAKLSHAGTIVEIGSFLGNSTIYLAMAGGEVHAVDPHTPVSMEQLGEQAYGLDASEQFLRNLMRFGVRERVVYHRASSLETAKAWSGEAVRLLYVDGMHTYKAVWDDYMAWRPFLAPQHVVLFDDYLWTEVQHAVDDLRAQVRPLHFYVRGGQAIFSTAPLSWRDAGLA